MNQTKTLLQANALMKSARRVSNPNCDGARCVAPNGEVRLLPTGGDSNAILCVSCYMHEIDCREERNRELSNDCKFKLPLWRTLDVYAPEGMVAA